MLKVNFKIVLIQLYSSCLGHFVSIITVRFFCSLLYFLYICILSSLSLSFHLFYLHINMSILNIIFVSLLLFVYKLFFLLKLISPSGFPALLFYYVFFFSCRNFAMKYSFLRNNVLYIRATDLALNVRSKQSRHWLKKAPSFTSCIHSKWIICT